MKLPKRLSRLFIGESITVKRRRISKMSASGYPVYLMETRIGVFWYPYKLLAWDREKAGYFRVKV